MYSQKYVPFWSNGILNSYFCMAKISEIVFLTFYIFCALTENIIFYLYFEELSVSNIFINKTYE